MAQSQRPDDLASICSSLSSDEGGRTGSSEHLVDLLTRPRERGGYGGRLNYTEFSSLATSLGWTEEDMDDCWYDIMMGEPSAEATNMARVAECICSYCLAAPLPLLENYKLEEDDDGGVTAPPVEEVIAPAAPPALSATPPRPPTPPAALSSTCVVLSPPSPRAPQSPHATRSNAKRRAHVPAGTLPRYAVETVSSERRRLSSTAAAATHASSSSPSRGRILSKSPARITAAAAAASPTDANTVFFRLYENGMEQHRKRSSAKPLPDAAVEAECTFTPRIAPYAMKDSGDGTARSAHFNKPTKSHFAKLTGEPERSTDALAHAPETPRVNYHPAPGPSSIVPPGYVEGVARLRRYVASRYDSAGSHLSIRDTPRRDVHRLVDAPILRLPVTVEGVSDTVDVRLAGVHRPPPSSSSHLQQDLPPPPLPRYRDEYNGDVADTYTAASIPRRSPSAVVRYKEHLRFY